jgi:hypothetical protein
MTFTSSVSPLRSRLSAPRGEAGADLRRRTGVEPRGEEHPGWRDEVGKVPRRFRPHPMPGESPRREIGQRS